MLYFVQVEIEHVPYMNLPRRFTQLHTIEAEDWEAAGAKLRLYYHHKCEPNGDSYRIINEEWAEHIP